MRETGSVETRVSKRGRKCFLKQTDKEVDFAAISENEKIYIQVSNSIEEDKTKERELFPLMKVKDAYPKMIITRTGYPEYDIEGDKDH